MTTSNKDSVRASGSTTSETVEIKSGADTPTEKHVRVNGFQQVIDMLRVADPAFRESLLERLALRDRELAAQLRREFIAQNN